MSGSVSELRCASVTEPNTILYAFTQPRLPALPKSRKPAVPWFDRPEFERLLEAGPQITEADALRFARGELVPVASILDACVRMALRRPEARL